VNELITFVIAEEIPLTIVWNVFVVVANVFVLMIEAFEVTPFTFEVKVLVAEDRVCEVMIDEVAVTPLIVVVSTFPAAD
jgi:hypothetical protein